MTENPIILQTGALAKITLNAPKKLNALAPEMCLPLGNKLAEWKNDKNVKAVLIKGAGDKAFCAGGDIVDVVNMGKTNPAEACKFFWAEYRTNWRIKMFPKPYIAFIDGITMGGGVGVSVHGHYRIATERTMFAMPETMIGFFPDVGGSYFLSRLEGNMGMFLGLTGYRLNGVDLLELGIATHYIESNKLDALEAALSNIEFNEDGFTDVETVLNNFCSQPEINNNLKQANRLFEGENLATIISNLKADDSDFSSKILKNIQKMSPTSLHITFEEIKRGVHLPFDKCLQMEMRLAWHVMQNPDFYEGVRALLIDKDRSPKWQPDNISDVSKQNIQSYFQTIDNELFFDWDKPVEFNGTI